MILAQSRFGLLLLAAAFACAALFPLSARASDGTPPNPPSVTVNGTPLPQVAPFDSSLIATSSSLWNVMLTFDEDIALPPMVKDGTPSFNFENGALQSVSDCGDADQKTFCFIYTPPLGIEAAVFWFFQVSAAQDLSGESMGEATYRFIADTAGPILAFAAVTDGVALPTISGDSSFGSATVDITLMGGDNRAYQVTASGGFWSYTLQPGEELPPGTYTVRATGTDQYGNGGDPIETFITVPVGPPPGDTTPPVLSENAAVGSVWDTTPSYTFMSSEAGTVLYGGTCWSGDIVAMEGLNTITFSELGLGTYSDCTISVTDAAGNTSAPLFVTPFTIVPVPPGSLLITVTATGGDGTFSFSGDLGAFTVTTSGGLGQTEFTDIAAGDYALSAATPSGWSLGPNSCAAVTVTPGETATCAVSYAKNTTSNTKGYIVGLLFNDKDGDGTLDRKGEVTLLGASGWKVYLDANNNGTRDSGETYTTTSLFGLYLFKNVAPGTYTVRIETKPGKTITKPSSGFYTATVVKKHATFAGLFGFK